MKFKDQPNYKLLYKTFPKTNDLIRRKRYNIPQHLVMDYLSQDTDNDDTFFRTVSHFLLLLTESHSLEKTMTPSLQVVTLVNWIDHDCKMTWLERDLGEMLMRTAILPDLSVQDLLFPWPCFRVMIPMGLIPIVNKDDPIDKNLCITSITLSMEESVVPIHPVLKGEVQNLLSARGVKVPSEFVFRDIKEYPSIRRMCILFTVANHRSDHEDTGLYFIREPIDATPVKQSVLSMGHVEMGSEEMAINRPAIALAKHLAFNILVYLSSVPSIAKPMECIRKEKAIGHTIRPAIYQPQWIGDKVFSQFRDKPKKLHELTGRTIPCHWVCGHWRRRPFNPELDAQQRRVQWIKPYHTGHLLDS